MSFAIEFFFNVLLTVLLAFTVGYCWILNRRIRMLQDSGSELAELMKHFDTSTARASESIMALQSASKKIGETIQARIDKANFLIEDLTFLIDRAGSIADNMEAGIAASRQRPQANEASRLRTQRRELAEAGDNDRFSALEEPLRSAKIESDEPSAATMATLQAMLDKISTRKNEAPAAPPARGPKLSSTPDKPRSQAEQELLQMIRKGSKA